MAKSKLSLDDLEVESFVTTPEGDDSKQGTVRGYWGETDPGMFSCDQQNTCDPSCGMSCPGTCESCPSDCGDTCPRPCEI